MLYIVGGAARSGKTILADRFMLSGRVSYFSLDFLMMGLAKGLPEARVDPESPSTEVGERMWPIVRAMATTILEDGVDYLLEGDLIQPSHVAVLMEAFPGEVRACFLGYESVDPNAKLGHIRQHGYLPDDWLKCYDDDWALDFIRSMIRYSQHLHEECRATGIPYFDVSTDFEQALAESESYLRTGTLDRSSGNAAQQVAGAPHSPETA